MKRLVMLLLCLGVLSTVTGCYVAPHPYSYPYYGGYAGADVSVSIGRSGGGHHRHHHHGYYRGFRYGGYTGHARWHRYASASVRNKGTLFFVIYRLKIDIEREASLPHFA